MSIPQATQVSSAGRSARNRCVPSSSMCTWPLRCPAHSQRLPRGRLLLLPQRLRHRLRPTKDSLSGMRATDFMVARWIRLYPLYLLGTIVGLTFLLATNNATPGVLRALVDAPSLRSSVSSAAPLRGTPFRSPSIPPAWSHLCRALPQRHLAALMRLQCGQQQCCSRWRCLRRSLTLGRSFEASTLDLGMTADASTHRPSARRSRVSHRCARLSSIVEPGS